MAKMTKEEALAWDKENAGFKAAAQAFMARRLGYHAVWSIYRNWNDEDARFLERTSTGRVRPWVPLEPRRKVVSPHDIRMIYLAGELAHYVKDEPDLDCYQACNYLERYFDTRDLARCLELLKPEMPKIQREVEETESHVPTAENPDGKRGLRPRGRKDLFNQRR